MTTFAPPARSLSRITPAPGLLGQGHTAVEVVRPTALADGDPFLLLNRSSRAGQFAIMSQLARACRAHRRSA
jgi:hypothetical protein